MGPKLYELTTSDFRLPVVVSRTGGLIDAPAGHLPVLFWPDGAVCWEGNLFLLEGFHKHLSRKNRGGTLRDHAKHLSHLIRFCFQNRITFTDLTDAWFTMFVHGLLAERRRGSPELTARQNAQVAKIAHLCLSFFNMLDGLYPKVGLISPGGRIRAEKKTYRVKTRSGFIERTYFHHHSIPEPEPSRRRQPVPTDAITSLVEANAAVSPSTFLRRRRYVMLRLFEITGARRIEVSNITVRDLLKAMETGALTLYTAKTGRDDDKRDIPIADSDLTLLLDYVHKYRARIIRSTIGATADDGYLLVSERSGRALAVETLSNEMAKLRKAANLEYEVVLHCFRHRFATKVFVGIISQYQCSTVADVRSVVLAIEGLKRRVMEWTGHKDMRSLDRYVHLAFAEVGNFKEAFDLVALRSEIESLKTNLREMRDELAACSDPAQASLLIDGMVERVVEKLERLEPRA